MFRRLITRKQILARRILFDSWYAWVADLKQIHCPDWTFFTTLKSNRLVSLHRDTGYQHLDTLVVDDTTLATGLIVRPKEVFLKVKLFKLEP